MIFIVFVEALLKKQITISCLLLLIVFGSARDVKASPQKARSPDPTPTQVWQPETLNV